MPLEHSPKDVGTGGDDAVLSGGLEHFRRRELEEAGVKPKGARAVMEQACWTQDSIEVGKGKSGDLLKVLAIESLLAQFGNSQVRADFVNGRFICLASPDRLKNLDVLRWTLFPRWSGGPLDEPGVNFQLSSVHLSNLVVATEECATIGEDLATQGITYAQWYRILIELASDPYWRATPPTQRCAHFEEDSQLAPQMRTPKDLKRVKFQRPFPYNQPNSGQHCKEENTSQGCANVEEVTLFSTPENSADSCSDESTTSASSGSSCQRRTKRRGDKREVVVPPPFEMNGRMKLDAYFASFEEYFVNKYRGNDYDRCQHLEKFLEGELLDVYRSAGGRHLKYQSMKTKLLKYFKKTKVGSRSYWRSELQNCTLNEGEALDLYGLRLLGIAELAFPKSTKECASQVRSQFLKTIPNPISRRILDAECAMKAFSGGKSKHLSFSAISEMARDLQGEKPQSHSVMWAQAIPRQRTSTTFSRSGNNGAPSSFPANTPPSQARWEDRPPRMSHQRFSPTRSGGTARSFSSTPKLYCGFCGKRNHKEENCWRLTRSCLICGGSHLMRDCSHYNPDFKEARATSGNFNDSAPRGGN